jgi:ribosome biogenesis protein ENP2
VSGVPAVTALSFQDGLTMGVGMSTGQVLLYDVRSNKPFLIKDHNYDLPIKKIVFHNSSRNVLSQDSRILKIWEQDSVSAPNKVKHRPIDSIPGKTIHVH